MTSNLEPTFFVAGTQKAGTTFLCHQLAIHPQIYFSTPKELMFFQRRDVGPGDYAEYLSRYFRAPKTAIHRGEGSTVYFQSDIARQNMLKLVNTPFRLIVSLRHPVEKALSFYMHNFVRGRLSGKEAIDEMGESRQLCHIRQSQYADAFKQWIKSVGLRRIHVTTLEELKSDPESVTQEICQFLNIGAPQPIQLQNRNRGVPYATEGTSIVPQKELTLGDHQISPRFSIESIHRLHDVLKPDIDATENILGRTFPSWHSLPSWMSGDHTRSVK